MVVGVSVLVDISLCDPGGLEDGDIIDVAGLGLAIARNVR